MGKKRKNMLPLARQLTLLPAYSGDREEGCESVKVNTKGVLIFLPTHQIYTEPLKGHSGILFSGLLMQFLAIKF